MIYHPDNTSLGAIKKTLLVTSLMAAREKPGRGSIREEGLILACGVKEQTRIAVMDGMVLGACSLFTSRGTGGNKDGTRSRVRVSPLWATSSDLCLPRKPHIPKIS